MGNTVYNSAIDKKWQKIWEDTHLYRFDESNAAKKHYLLEMFSYPSGKTLHIGHWWNYSLSDIYGRFKRMQGYELFHPPGFDALGLPAENYALKAGVHPEDSTRENIATMERQFRTMGTSYDWDHEIVTCDPEYYKWTQWLFLKLYDRGLAYRKEAPVNWCSSCATVLANEQAAGGRCERCDTEIVKKDMTQWFFRITDYAEELLGGLTELDWPEKTKKIQENWIGKSLGCEIDFEAGGKAVTVYTTRADTIMGATYVVLAPEHPMAALLTLPERLAEVKAYQVNANKMSEIERTSTAKAKTGVFTGSYASHPVSGKRLPIWIADYVLPTYGTGAVMAVPAHDERDYEFAIKYGLPVVPVIRSPQFSETVLPFCGDGVLINSAGFDGLASGEAQDTITSALIKMGRGRQAVKYRLRDWLVSRQRYWGTPIPIVYCGSCGTVPVPETDLPIKLPYDVSFMPTGHSPLSTCKAYVNTACPICGKPAKRDTDTLDTFVCSSWYYLRFPDNKNGEKAFDKIRAGKLMPVDKYVGGVEHAAMHLLYARFVTKALRDMGYLDFGEPFASLVHQGFILGGDGKKMSKRNGAVSPDDIVDRYGADVFRLHLGFGFSFLEGGPWSDGGIKAVERFVSRICRAADNFIRTKDGAKKSDTTEKGAIISDMAEKGAIISDMAEYGINALEPDASVVSVNGPPGIGGLDYARHNAIRQVAENIEAFQFNTAIARIMEFLNALEKYQAAAERNRAYDESCVRDLILLLAPFAPHLAEELWSLTGYGYSVHSQAWPAFDANKLIKDKIQMAVQVNGTLRGVIDAPPQTGEDILLKAALEDVKIKASIGGREIVKMYIVKERLINIIC